ncbi:kinase-like protein [Marasmius fiardii PR-910]|nr:kinase-like protein [Marasmius fiardii PR-910]
METGFSEVELNRFQKELQHVFDDELNRLQVELQDVFEDKVKREAWVEERGQDAQDAQVWLDRLHQLVYYPSISSQFKCSVSTTISQLSEMSGLYPTCLTIRKVRKIGDLPMAAGSLGPIWKCAIGKSTMPQTVGLKLVMMDYSNLSEQMRKFCQAFVVQVSVWRQLQHPNVLPLLGIYFFEGRRELCLISPWMEKGNLVAYVRSTPREDVDHYALAYDVANGLSYLHSKDIVHGELRGVNVLITSSGRACIGDFGVYPVALSHNLISLTEPSFAPVSNALWWLAPEGWRGAGPSKESDMYAYARVCYEVSRPTF